MNQKRATPYFVYAVLLASVTLIALMLSMSQDQAETAFEAFGVIPSRIRAGSGLHALLTYMFLHSGIVHFALNAFSLLQAGIPLERSIGSVRFGALYVSSGVVAAIVHCLVFPDSSVPLVGASGAIFGAIAVLCLLMPFKTTFLLFIPLPAVLVGVLTGVVEVYSAIHSLDPSIAHFAHLGGFVFGVVVAFAIDFRRALKGFAVSTIVFAALYVISRWLVVS